MMLLPLLLLLLQELLLEGTREASALPPRQKRSWYKNNCGIHLDQNGRAQGGRKGSVNIGARQKSSPKERK